MENERVTTTTTLAWEVVFESKRVHRCGTLADALHFAQAHSHERGYGRMTAIVKVLEERTVTRSVFVRR